jgi:hypothetical protein
MSPEELEEGVVPDSGFLPILVPRFLRKASRERPPNSLSASFKDEIRPFLSRHRRRMVDQTSHVGLDRNAQGIALSGFQSTAH